MTDVVIAAPVSRAVLAHTISMVSPITDDPEDRGAGRHRGVDAPAGAAAVFNVSQDGERPSGLGLRFGSNIPRQGIICVWREHG